MEVRIEDAQRDMDAYDLYDNLREEDMLECLGLMTHPRDAVYHSVGLAKKCYSVRSDSDGLYCCFGVGPLPSTPNVGVAWLLGTRKLPKIRKFFLKNSKDRLNDLLEGFDYLTNFVMEINTLSVRWLTWLGAEFNDCQHEGYKSFILKRK